VRVTLSPAPMPTRHQRGYLFRKGGFWYVRFYDNVAQPDGRIVRQQVCRKVVPYDDRFRTKTAVAPLVADVLKSANSGGCVPESVLTVAQFIEDHYLPYTDREKRASTSKGYRDVWRFHVAAKLDKVRLCDFQPVHGERLMQAIARDSGYHLSRTTLKHIKSFLSGVFTYARRQGALSSANPMQGVSIPRGAEPKDTHAYSLEQITRMLAVLSGPARVLVATAAFTGLRRSEIRGLSWEDYEPASNGQFGEIRVERSVWGKHVQPTKTRRSRASVPVIPALEKILAELRAERGNPRQGFIFESPRNRKPLDLDTFAKLHIEPILAAHGQKWRWWHPFRRGLATNLHRIGVDDKTIQSILRHSSVQTTREIYIKGFDGDAVAAMKRLETAIQSRPN
jgi:integrase